MEGYFEKLQSSPVHNVGDIIAFNRAHADIELPPGEPLSLYLALRATDPETKTILCKTFWRRVQGTC